MTDPILPECVSHLDHLATAVRWGILQHNRELLADIWDAERPESVFGRLTPDHISRIDSWGQAFVNQYHPPARFLPADTPAIASRNSSVLQLLNSLALQRGTNRVLLVNTAFAEVFGWPADVILQQQIELPMLFHNDDMAQALADAVRCSMLSDGNVSEADGHVARILHFDGHFIPCQVHFTLLVAPNRVPIYTITRLTPLPEQDNNA